MINWIRIRDDILNVIFILTSAILIVLALSFGVYYLTINLGLSDVNLSVNNTGLMKEYFNMMNYLINPFEKKLEFIYFTASQNGLSHFFEVKRLFLINNLVFLIVVIAKKILKVKLRFFYTDAISIGMVPVLIFGLGILDFNQLFIWFHQLLFRNNNWLFNPTTDPIILALPESFFEIMILIFLICFETMIIYGYKKRRTNLN